MPIFKSRSFSFPKYARQGAAKKKPAQKNGLMEYELVAWTGIEPVTRGFSTHVAAKQLVSMRVTAHFRVT